MTYRFNWFVHLILWQVSFGKYVSCGNISQSFSLPVVVSDHCMIWAVPVLVPHVCPFWRVVHLRLFCQSLDYQKSKWDLVSLDVELAGQGIHKLRLCPGKEGQPVLIPHCSMQHELFRERDLGLGTGLLMLSEDLSNQILHSPVSDILHWHASQPNCTGPPQCSLPGECFWRCEADLSQVRLMCRSWPTWLRSPGFPMLVSGLALRYFLDIEK